MTQLLNLFKQTKPNSQFAALEDAGEAFGGKYNFPQVEAAYNEFEKIN